MKLKIFLSCVCGILPLLGCTNKASFTVTDSRPRGATILAACAPRSIEIGIRNDKGFGTDIYEGVPVKNIEFRSTVIIRRESGNQAAISSAELPSVLWFSPSMVGTVDHIGLQDVDLPFSLFCRNYVIEVTYESLPEWVLSGPVDAEDEDTLFYARKSRK